MNRHYFLICLIIIGLSLAGVSLTAAWADVGASASPELIKQLSDKIDRLENRLKQVEAKPSSETQAVPAYAPPQEGGVLRAMEGINVSGYVETSYNFNTHKPDHGALNAFNNRGGLNDLRTFDQYENSFVLNAIKLTLDKPIAETGGIGGRIDLMFGEDAKLLNSVTKSSQFSNRLQSIDSNGNTANINDVDNVAIEQAYGLLRAPYGNGIDIYFGKFVTLLGVEVIENKDNWNASRGLIFNYAIPFTHTGLRTSYNWNEKFQTILGVNNGGDQEIDDNNVKTIEGKATYKFNDKITLSQAINVGFGSETPTGNQDSSTLALDGYSDNNQHRGQTLLILDSIVGVKMTDKWSVNFESVWGQNGFGQWYGAGLWNRYEYNDWIAFSHRFEYFNDSSNARLGGVVGSDYTDDGFDAWETTFGIDLKAYKNLLTRLEYRFDNTPGSKRIENGESDFQSTFFASLIYCF